MNAHICYTFLYDRRAGLGLLPHLSRRAAQRQSLRRGARTASHPAHGRQAGRGAGESARRQSAVHALAKWSAAHAHGARSAATRRSHGGLRRRHAARHLRAPAPCRARCASAPARSSARRCFRRRCARSARRIPSINIELSLSNANADLLRRDADVAVRMVQPSQKALFAKRVGPRVAGVSRASAVPRAAPGCRVAWKILHTTC